MATVPARHAFTVSEWELMGRAGLFGEDDRVELVDGEVVEMSPIGPQHAVGVGRLARLFFDRAGDRVAIRVQDPVRLDERSEPQPDLVLARPPLERYLAGHPGPGDLLLVVEVADTSLDYDRDHKAPLYARAGVPETWVEDLAGHQVQVMRQPGARGYGAVVVAGRGDTITLEALGLTVEVDDILGPG